jgi:FkbM family methyltransferase
MSTLGFVKQLAISTGFYKPARAMHRVIFPSERRRYWEHKALLGQFVNSGDLVFDVGANIGNRVEILLSLGATVVAFEPQPICVRELLARDNGHLTVIQKAVGETEGDRTFYFANPGDALASMIPNWYDRVGTSSMNVPVTTLDKAIEQFGVPKFCKIDVEGFEVEVLKGLSRAIPVISIEYVSWNPRGVAKIAECLAITAKLGAYKVNLIGQEDATLLLPNWLSIPDFLRAFPGCSGGHPWGDLFLTTTMQ